MVSEVNSLIGLNTPYVVDTQWVIMNGERSSEVHVKSGVPHGSVLRH